MTITNGYTTLAAFKNYKFINATVAAEDLVVHDVIQRASRAVETLSGRRFFTAIETRYYTPVYGDLLFIDDLMSITSLKTDEDSDRTYEVTWTATDYDLEPYNAAYLQPPAAYTMIRTTPNGSYSFPMTGRGAQVVGRFGLERTETCSGTLAEDLDTSETAVDVSNGALFSPGHRIRIDSEEFFVDAVATNTLTVRRGVNGTTAAVHTTGAAITYALPPEEVEQACLIIARDLFLQRFGEPSGSAGAITPDGVRLLPGSFSRVALDLLRPYRRLT